MKISYPSSPMVSVYDLIGMPSSASTRKAELGIVCDLVVCKVIVGECTCCVYIDEYGSRARAIPRCGRIPGSTRRGDSRDYCGSAQHCCWCCRAAEFNYAGASPIFVPPSPSRVLALPSSRGWKGGDKNNNHHQTYTWSLCGKPNMRQVTQTRATYAHVTMRYSYP